MTGNSNTVIIVHSITNLSENIKRFVQLLTCGAICERKKNQTNIGGRKNGVQNNGRYNRKKEQQQ